jgi:hypothetical protein
VATLSLCHPTACHFLILSSRWWSLYPSAIRLHVILSFCHLSACQCISCHFSSAVFYTSSCMRFLSIQLLLVCLSSVIQLLFVIRAFIMHLLMLVIPLLSCNCCFHLIVTFPFVIQLSVTSSSCHQAACHLFIRSSSCFSLSCQPYLCHVSLLSFSACHLLILLLSLFLQSMRRCLTFHHPFLRLSAPHISFLSYDVSVTFPFAIRNPVTPLSVTLLPVSSFFNQLSVCFFLVVHLSCIQTT